MVDIEYLQKNYIGYESGIINEAGFIREDFLKYLEACEMGGKESAKGQWNDLYKDLVFLIAHFRIAGVDFESHKLKEDVYSALEYIEKCERKRRGENEHQ